MAQLMAGETDSAGLLVKVPDAYGLYPLGQLKLSYPKYFECRGLGKLDSVKCSKQH